jgi:hypothetical protein
MLPREALDFILTHVEVGSTVVEFGSGHGSEILAERFRLISFEHDEDWLGVTSSHYIHAPIQPNHYSDLEGENGWYEFKTVVDNWPKEIDCVIIDGPTGVIGRTGILSIIDLLREVPMILVDDVDRPQELKLSQTLAEQLDLEMNICEVEKPRQSGTDRRYAILSRGDKI